MSYPAYEAFARDVDVTYARWRVYMALRPPFLSLDPRKPREVKLDVVHRIAHVSRGEASKALGWLIIRGYIVLHGRDARGMPSLSMAYECEAVPVPQGNRLAG